MIVELLVCDRPQAPVVERAKPAGIDTFVFRPKDYASREAYEPEIIAELRSAYRPDRHGRLYAHFTVSLSHTMEGLSMSILHCFRLFPGKRH